MIANYSSQNLTSWCEDASVRTNGMETWRICVVSVDGKNLLDLGGPATDETTGGSSRRSSTGLLHLSVPALNETRYVSYPSLFVFSCISMVLVGCVGPGIPGDRYGDEIPAEFHGSETHPPLSHHCEAEETEPPKEIPWPMFHPIPTRPVFAGSPHQD